MPLWEALLYGLVQGLTEYLPISSSAHLILLPRFLGTEDPGLAFDVFLHVGTLLATLAYFWRDWVALLRTFPGLGFLPDTGVETVDSWKWIVIGTIPAVVAGVFVHDMATTIFRGNIVLMVTLPLGGILLVTADWLGEHYSKLRGVGWWEALWVGVAQCLALLPGMSRSGVTITGARLLGFTRDAAARFSFLLSAPITLGAIVFKAQEVSDLASGPVGMGGLWVAGLGSFISGMLAIGILLRLARRAGYLGFAIYRMFLAGAIFFLLGI